MTGFFPRIPQIRYEGPQSKNPMAFKYYDPDRIIQGKRIAEHLPFAMAWWHNLCNEGKDMFGAFILGMDTFTLGLIKAAAISEDGRIDSFLEERYASYRGGIGARIRSGKAALAECAAHAEQMKQPALPGSGRQEYLESIVNGILFG